MLLRSPPIDLSPKYSVAGIRRTVCAGNESMTDKPASDHDESETTQPTPETTSTTNTSGGVQVNAPGDVNIGGDVVGRDKITENIAGDKVVATGKNVIQIGKLNVPLKPLIAALGLGLAALFFVALVSTRTQLQVEQILPTPTPVKMTGDFNVLVAEFGEENTDGKVQAAERARNLSKTVFETLTAQKEAFPDVAIKTAVDLRYGDAAATGVMVVDETSADQVAQRVGAQMVIYGAIDRQGGFTPKFYVVPEARGQISALSSGSFQFGDEPIRVGGSQFNANADLRVRASALLYIIMGMTYDFFGRVEQSLDIYQRAADQLKGWAEKGQGKEVLYFLWGQAALFKQQKLDCRSDQSADAEWRALNAEAKTAFGKALKSNADYTRAMIGLGDVSNLRIQCLTSTAEALTLPELSEMFARYEQALDRAQAARAPFMQNLATFSLAGAAYLQGAAYRFAQEVAKATASFDKAIELLESIESYFDTAQHQRELAQVYLLRGAVNKQYAETLKEQGDRAGARSRYEEAQRYYQRCVDQKSRAPEDRVLTDVIVHDRCQPGLEAVTEALKLP